MQQLFLFYLRLPSFFYCTTPSQRNNMQPNTDAQVCPAAKVFHKTKSQRGSMTSSIKTVTVDTDAGSHFAYRDLPVQLVEQLMERQPIPVTIGGTSGRTWTLNASVTKPVRLMIGQQFCVLRASVAYSFVVGTNVYLDSTGAEVNRTNDTTGVKYMYISFDATAGTYEILPSDTAPAYAAGARSQRVLVHPGTAAAQDWTYVGFTICSATTPTYHVAEKIGFEYNYVSVPGTPILTVVISTTLGTMALDLPKHGVEVRGTIETGATAGNWAYVTPSVTDTVGGAYAQTSASAVMMVPHGYLPVPATGLMSGDAAAAGDWHVSAIKDVV